MVKILVAEDALALENIAEAIDLRHIADYQCNEAIYKGE